MQIPEKVIVNKKEYIFIKKYSNFALYINLTTGIRKCFGYHELGLIKPIYKKYKRINLHPERTKL